MSLLPVDRQECLPHHGLAFLTMTSPPQMQPCRWSTESESKLLYRRNADGRLQLHLP